MAPSNEINWTDAQLNDHENANLLQKNMQAWWWAHGFPTHLKNNTSQLFWCCRNAPPRHLKSSHEIDRSASEEPSGLSTTALASLRNNQDFSLSVFRGLLLGWIVNDNIAFRKVDSKNFQALLVYLEGRLEGKIGSRFSVRRWIMNAYTKHTKVIKAKLAKAQSLIHLSFDLWTSRSLLSLNGIVVHFVDETFEARTFLLALPQQEGEHTGVNIADTGPIGKLHRITTWIYKSGQRKARFHKAQETMGIKKSETLDLVKDVKTRWNSTHDMIKRAKRLKQGLDYFIDKEALEERAGIGGADAGYVIENRLSKEDWEILEEYVEFLDPLAVATKVLQSNPGKHSAGQQKQGLAANVLLAFEYILNHMEKMNEKYQGQGAKDRHLSAVVELAWDKCTEYYRKLDDTPIYIAGVILHPSHKWQRLETLWGGSKKTRRWIQEGKAKIKAFWESDYKTFEVPDDTPREQSTRSEFELFLEGRSQKDPLAPLDDAGIIDDLFANVSVGKPPDAGEDVEDVEELAEAFEGFGLEEDIEDEEESEEEEDDE
ncbi:hypothetical protein Egran_02841 [Elaphomyces granulatus]|uniref:hAT-like transposase RNase-H fold domain-containing protein n=1 Tax=Elaphomyces granulatus TaxID=519963 RepID=A0A232LZ68_9EURO|nr:hypothetical protein Egran_02841 [Elaphomyces granulatus]